MSSSESMSRKNVRFARLSRSIPAAALAAVLAVGLAGCGSVPQPAAQAGRSEQSEASITQAQAQRIEKSLHATLDEADSTGDPTHLSARLSGPELAIRTSQVTVARSTKKKDPRTILPVKIRQQVLTQTSGWPRNVLAITSTTSDQQSERLLVLNQASARTNYKLWGLVRLFSGVRMPSFAVGARGSREGTAKDSGLVSTPVQAVKDYALALNNIQLTSAEKIKSSGLSAKQQARLLRVQTDQFRSELANLDSSVNQGVTANQGTETQVFTPDLSSLKIFRSARGGDLVVASIDSTWTRTAGDGRLSQPASDAEKALFGNGTATSTMRVQYANVVALYVPPASKNAKIQAVGAERQPVKVDAVK